MTVKGGAFKPLPCSGVLFLLGTQPKSPYRPASIPLREKGGTGEKKMHATGASSHPRRDIAEQRGWWRQGGSPCPLARLLPLTGGVTGVTTTLSAERVPVVRVGVNDLGVDSGVRGVQPAGLNGVRGLGRRTRRSVFGCLDLPESDKSGHRTPVEKKRNEVLWRFPLIVI